MSEQHIVWLGVAVLAVIVVGMLFRRRKTGRDTGASAVQPSQADRAAAAPVPAAVAAIEVKPALPQAIVFGTDAQHAGVRIGPLADEERFRSAKPLPADSDLGARLNAGLQAVPAMLVEEGHRGKQFMEVVINGDLVRAADGVGQRAWTVGADNKISEHAKLFEADKLQNLVNAATIWQIASVVVAQKHLADISAKLENLRKGIGDITSFLDQERRAKLTGTYDYLTTAAVAIAKGELSPSVRHQLESCERELQQVEQHLLQELEHRCTQAVVHKEFAGTADLGKDTVAKYEQLMDLPKDLRMTLKTRALAWYVLSLYPGEPMLKQARMDALIQRAEEIEQRLQTINASMETDCEQFMSPWNKKETLKIRQTNVRDAANALVNELRDVSATAKADIRATHSTLLAHDQSTSLLFEVEDGKIGAFHIAEPARRAA